jgi:general secretion pathway protein B
MSYILDALKKIEHEKNRKSSGGRINISGDLFQERKQTASKAGVWKVVALIAAASLLTSAGTWFVLNGSSTKNAAVIRQSAPPPSTPVTPPVVTPPVPAPIQAEVKPVVASPAAPPGAVSATQKQRETAGNDVSPGRDVRRQNNLIKAQPAAPKPPAQTVQAPADIKLSGIAWQEERFSRRAVINGFLLKEGAIVSGAKISEILADRVRFSSAAGTFEIRLDAVLPAEVKR